MDDTSQEHLEAIDEAGDLFEKQWKQGRRPRIADFVEGKSPGLARHLLRHLLRVEIELRRGAGEVPIRPAYEVAWPEHLDLVREAFEGDGESSPPTMAIGPSSAGFRSRSDAGPPDLDGCEIEEMIGQGGMGVVYKSWQEGLKRYVAIKIISGGSSSGRFLREACLIANIDSPYVVKIHGFQTLRDGRQALIMEHVDGIDLARWMMAHDGPLDESEVLPWMRQVAEGMRDAAVRGIIHRDLKPSNILIDSQRRARIVDFGLARGPSELAQDLTRSNDMFGTPHYMAIEQAEDPQGVDTRADIYSFGALFYHALTGTLPFEGKTAFSILYRNKTEPLVSPQARNPELSGWVSDLLERCLAKSPANRFPTFAELLKQLQRPIDAASPWETSDGPAYSSYIKSYKASRDAYLTGPPALGYCGRYEFPRGRVLRIIRGNLVDQKVEALVNSSNSDLSGDYGVSRALFEAGGWVVRRDAAGLAPVRPGRVAVTSAGDLPARFLFHAVTSGEHALNWVLPSRDLIGEIMAGCFYHADSYNVASIAFPLLGTGAAGFSREVCLDAMFRFLARTFLGRLTCVREARIVIYPLERT